MYAHTRIRGQVRSRAAFTLIELLVVMAIIAILIGLTTGAVFKVLATQEKAFTETTITKTASALDLQMKAAVDDARNQEVRNYANLEQLAGYDRDRAQAILTKMWLKREFPTNFTEAKSNVVITAGSLVVTVPANPIYVQALAGVPSSVLTPEEESSACLCLALSIGRRGMASVNLEESLGPTAISERDVGGKKLRIIVDAWGEPISFYRWPVGNTELPTGGDPQDPSGSLVKPSWNNSNNAATITAVESALHSIRDPNNGTPKAIQLVPVVASAGRNKKMGLDPRTMGVSNADEASDNIYSYRLRRFGDRGD